MLDLGKERATALPPSDEPEAALEPVDILLVDDRPDGLLTLEAVLKGPAYNLVTARSGREAILRVRERRYAAILLDVQMPGMDGFETARRIRHIDKANCIPIIFVTAINKDLGHVYEGYDTGAVDYIFKPFDPRVLASKVAVFAELFRKTRKIEQQAEALREHERLRFAEQVSRIELENAQRYQSLVDAVPHIVCLLDAGGRAQLLNRTWFEYTGLSEEASSGEGWRSPFPPEDVRRISDEMAAHNFPDATFELECRILGRLGEFRWHLIRGEAQPPEKGSAAGCWLITATDIHELKTAQMDNAALLERERATIRALEEKRVALERSNHDLEQFAYVASHDLQEPLRKVTTFMDLLTRRYASSLPDEAQKFVGFAVDGATRMHDLIQGLLAYSRVDRGIAKADVDTRALLDDITADLAHQIRDARATVVPGHLPTIRADATQLRQVLQNLIGNAVKFRNSEPPEIRVSVEERPNEWVFSVEDNGIGIEKEYSDRIFLIFQRLHPQGRFPGSGIGLSICKKIVERHGGRIWFESEMGRGTTFLFSIPRDAEE